jgi:hypothetical protein
MKQTETKPKQILFRFEPKFFLVCFEDTLHVASCWSAPRDLRIAFPAKLAGQGPPSHMFELAAKAPLQLL